MVGLPSRGMNVGSRATCMPQVASLREFIDYTTSMITDEDPLRGLLFYQDLGFSHTLHVHSHASSVPRPAKR